MPKTKPFSELAAKSKADPVRQARIETEKRAIEDAMALAELRTSTNGTCHFEHEEDLYLSTVRESVAALGGKLEVRAVFPDGNVTLVPAKR